MTKKNGFRLAVIFGASLVALWALSIASAHEGHKHHNAPVSAKKLKNPLQANEETIAAGRSLFNKHCASCYGEDGKAKTEIAAAMKKRPTDLTAKEMRGITDGEIYWVITNGIRKSGMPAFKSKVTDQERSSEELSGPKPLAGMVTIKARYAAPRLATRPLGGQDERRSDVL